MIYLKNKGYDIKEFREISKARYNKALKYRKPLKHFIEMAAVKPRGCIYTDYHLSLGKKYMMNGILIVDTLEKYLQDTKKYFDTAFMQGMQGMANNRRPDVYELKPIESILDSNMLFDGKLVGLVEVLSGETEAHIEIAEGADPMAFLYRSSGELLAIICGIREVKNSEM